MFRKTRTSPPTYDLPAGFERQTIYAPSARQIVITVIHLRTTRRGRQRRAVPVVRSTVSTPEGVHADDVAQRLATEQSNLAGTVQTWQRLESGATLEDILGRRAPDLPKGYRYTWRLRGGSLGRRRRALDYPVLDLQVAGTGRRSHATTVKILPPHAMAAATAERLAHLASAARRDVALTAVAAGAGR